MASKLANGSKYKDSWGRLTHLKTGIKRVTLKTMPRLNKLPLKQRHKSIQRRRSPWLRWFKRNCNSGQDLTRTKPRACQPFEVLEKVKTTVSILPFLPPLFSCGALIDLQSEGCGEGEGTLVLVLPVPGCCLRGVTTASSWQRKCTGILMDWFQPVSHARTCFLGAVSAWLRTIALKDWSTASSAPRVRRKGKWSKIPRQGWRLGWRG